MIVCGIPIWNAVFIYNSTYYIIAILVAVLNNVMIILVFLTRELLRQLKIISAALCSFIFNRTTNLRLY